MRKFIFGITIIFTVLSCKYDKKDYLIKFYEGEFDEIGVPTGYLNSKGDTIVPIGKYNYCYTDTIRDFGMVIENETGKILGIDKNENELFEVFKTDNGPDYIENGLFRIVKNNKIGYANSNGKIVISPQYNCAHSFVQGKAKVSDSCETKTASGQKCFFGTDWYFIDTKGNRIK